jgi:hypothetical protein
VRHFQDGIVVDVIGERSRAVESSGEVGLAKPGREDCRGRDVAEWHASSRMIGGWERGIENFGRSGGLGWQIDKFMSKLKSS